MNKIRILILGIAAISASSLSLAVAAAPPPVPAEKVVNLDNAKVVVASEVSFAITAADFQAHKILIASAEQTTSAAVSHAAVSVPLPKEQIVLLRAATSGRMSRHPSRWLALHDKLGEARQPEAGREPAERT